MYCPHCGKEIPDDSVFCPECGENVNETGEEFSDENEAAANDISDERRSKNTSGGNHNTPVLMTLIIAVAAVIIVFGILWSKNNEVTGQTTLSSDLSLISQNTLSSESESETSVPATTVTSVPVPTDTPTPTPVTEKIIVMPAATPTPITTEPETVDDSSDEDDWAEDDTDEVVDIGHGIEAPVSDFIFPFSSYQELTQEDIDDALAGRSIKEKHDMSQMIINEILARYGYTFGGQSETSRQAKEKFEDLEWYQEAQQYCPTNDSNDLIQQFNSVEKENVQQVNEWQKANDVYY